MTGKENSCCLQVSSISVICRSLLFQDVTAWSIIVMLQLPVVHSVVGHFEQIHLQCLQWFKVELTHSGEHLE